MSKDKENIFIEPWIDEEGWKAEVFSHVETPCYVVSEKHLEKNLKILKSVEEKAGCHILMALKSFSMFSMFPQMKNFISGTEASSVNEARLGYKKFGKEVHVFSPSYTDKNIKEYLKYADHIVFNSYSQWNNFKNVCIGKTSCGIRVNLEHSEVETSLYDPSKENSHFGVTIENFEKNNWEGIEGLHFHNLCESDVDALIRSLQVFDEKFGKYFAKLKWVNFGGGHHITRPGYDVDLLERVIKNFCEKYPHLSVYLEPGEAVALNTGVLIASVVDVFQNGMNIAVLDTSATCHMPDVIEMPYLPTVLDAKPSTSNNENSYRLVGASCLTGDIIGDYTFLKPLLIGDKIIFLNMAIYTMVKNNTFNGVNLPSIAILNKEGKIKIIKKFGYKDFKNRLS